MARSAVFAFPPESVPVRVKATLELAGFADWGKKMVRNTQLKWVSGFLAVGLAGFLWASEADELRAKAKQLRQEAAAQAGIGNAQAAEELNRRSEMVLKEAELLSREHSNPQDELRRMKERLADLGNEARRLAEANAPAEDQERVRREMQRVKSEFARHGVEPGPDAHPKSANSLEMAAQRLKHLRVATENLKLAGAHDLAQEAHQRAENLERELAEAKRQQADQHEYPPEVHAIQDLRHEVEQLRREIRELQQALKQKS